MRRRTAIAASILCIAATVAMLLAGDTDEGIVVRPEARAQTAPVPHKGDAADDPAIQIGLCQHEAAIAVGLTQHSRPGWMVKERRTWLRREKGQPARVVRSANMNG